MQEEGCVEQPGGVYEQHDQQEQRGVGETLDCIHCSGQVGYFTTVQSTLPLYVEYNIILAAAAK